MWRPPWGSRPTGWEPLAHALQWPHIPQGAPVWFASWAHTERTPSVCVCRPQADTHTHTLTPLRPERLVEEKKLTKRAGDVGQVTGRGQLWLTAAMCLPVLHLHVHWAPPEPYHWLLCTHCSHVCPTHTFTSTPLHLRGCKNVTFTPLQLFENFSY